MGQSANKVEVHGNVEIIPGLNLVSAWSDPLDEHLDFERCGLALITQIKTDSAGTLSFRVQEIDLLQFQVHKMFPHESGSELHVTVDVNILPTELDPLGRLTVVEDTRDMTQRLRHRRVWRIYREPLRVEMFNQPIFFEFHRSGNHVTDGMQTVLKTAIGVEVEVLPDQDGLLDPVHKSAISEDLGQHTDFDKLWDSLLKTLKTQEHNLVAKEVTTIVDEDNRAIVSVVMDREKLSATTGIDLGSDTILVLHLRYSKELKVLCLETSNPEHMVMDIMYLILHPEPLRVETWNVSPAPRQGDDIFTLKRYIDRMIAESGN